MTSLTFQRPFLVAFLIGVACSPTSAGTETDSATATTSSTTDATTTGTTAPTTGSTTTTASTSSSTTADPTTGGTTTSTGTSTGPVVTTGTTDTSTTSDTEAPPCVPKECLGKIYQCGDCIDNDADGLIDPEDVECVNPCDDDEGSFATGIPGDGMDACKQDCFFDGNSGAGDDDCAWNLKCDPLNPGAPMCAYDPDLDCPPQDPKCLESCNPPTGCDCFGCCSIFVDGMLHDVFLGDANCSIKNFDQCIPCTKTEDCNPEECMPELCKPCINQPLPPECEDPSCPDDTATCETNADCPLENEYCDPGGCCLPIPQ